MFTIASLAITSKSFDSALCIWCIQETSLQCFCYCFYFFIFIVVFVLNKFNLNIKNIKILGDSPQKNIVEQLF